MSSDSSASASSALPASYPAGSTFWRLQTDGRFVWVDGGGVARDAIGLAVPIGEVLAAGERVTEHDFASALVRQGRSSPLRLPSGEFIGGRRLKAARYALPPITASGQLPWAARTVRLFPVLDLAGAQLAELWFAWKDGAWHLGRSAFITDFEQRLRHDDCGRLCLAAEERDWATLDAFHPLALPWYCRSCGHNHPQTSWRTVRRSAGDDERIGDLLRQQRICPHGHERAVAG